MNLDNDPEDQKQLAAEADLTRWCLALLTMRVNTPAGEWLDDTFHRIYSDGWREAEEALGLEGASEVAILDLTNMADLLVNWLAQISGKAPAFWLSELRKHYVDPEEAADDA